MARNILFFGCGNMGTALMNRLQSDNIFILKKDRNKPIKHLNKNIKPIYLDYENNKIDLSYFDIIFIAIKPQDSLNQLSLFIKKFREFIDVNKTVFISIMAGVKIEKIMSVDSGPIKIVRTMPNLAVKYNEGILPYCCNKFVSKEEIKILKNTIFNKFAKKKSIVQIENEFDFDVYTALFGSGSAYIFHFQKIFYEIAIKKGLKEENAKNLVKSLFYGSSLYSLKANIDFDKLIDSVCSKGGTTEAAMKIFNKNKNFEDIILSAVNDAEKKSKELSNE